MVSVIGIPLDENSSFLKGTASAPGAIRAAFRSDSSNAFTEDGTDLSTSAGWIDEGNLQLSAMPRAFDEITLGIRAKLASGNKILSLGGDHSVTYPVVRAFGETHGPVNIVHFDAHADLYDTFEGNRFSHACPFARIMEEGLATRLVQLGIRTLTTHQREQARRFKTEIIEMKDWDDNETFSFDGPVYISLDLDALDPAFAPGVSHYEPGGLSTRQILSVIQKLQASVVGADIVELNPARDYNSMTAMVAAKFMKELLSKMLHE